MFTPTIFLRDRELACFCPTPASLANPTETACAVRGPISVDGVYMVPFHIESCVKHFVVNRLCNVVQVAVEKRRKGVINFFNGQINFINRG